MVYLMKKNSIYSFKMERAQSKKKKPVNARIWFGTWNNFPGEPKEALKGLHERANARYTVGQHEMGEQGTSHLQFVMFLNNAQRLTGMKAIHPTIHWEVSEGPAATEYVMKTETRVDGPWEFGKKPKMKKPKIDWEDVWKKACDGNLEAIDPCIRVLHYTKLKAIEKDHLKFIHADHVRGIWVHGEYGSGKSRWFRDNFPTDKVYAKLCNKWWDGYKKEPIVVMDDIDPTHKFLSQQLKLWSDRYGCVLEIKGGSTTSYYDWFVVTSQYYIDDVFDDEKTRGALKRRFHEVEIEDIEELREYMGIDKYNN